MPLERLTDHVAIVTGAASGIGRATAARLAAEGAKVLASDIAGDALEVACKEAQAGAAAGGEVVAHVADIADEDQAARTVATAIERWGRLDGLANIAGLLRTVRTHECDLATWNQVLGVNLTGTFLMCRAAIPHLIASKGAIVNAASTSSFFGHPWMAAYAASKGAIASMTLTLAVEYSQDGVRANAVAPGSVHSGITHNVSFPADLTKAESKLVRRIMSPTGFGEPEDVAAVVAMLLSSDGRHITGEVVRIDGGTHA
ncbi:MAG TPA: SDR family oxidoreductase [Aquihabitans sp.]|jgi:NAD(P)-dependent dehydrogenase (short-subunit alcohol dehydrogenase family)|nr:SDR family oxidoreductase [Aquihabitans sp.]